MKGREGGGGGEGVREEVTLQQHLDTTKGSWRMAPGVSAESRRTRGETTVSKSTSDAELFFQGDGLEAVLSPGNFTGKFGGPKVRFLVTESAGK